MWLKIWQPPCSLMMSKSASEPVRDLKSFTPIYFYYFISIFFCLFFLTHTNGKHQLSQLCLDKRGINEMLTPTQGFLLQFRFRHRLVHVWQAETADASRRLKGVQSLSSRPVFIFFLWIAYKGLFLTCCDSFCMFIQVFSWCTVRKKEQKRETNQQAKADV